jgi:hypothetical protein
MYKKQDMFPNAFIRTWKVFSTPSKHITCGDMIFSGHTTSNFNKIIIYILLKISYFLVLMMCAMVFR